jgi:hypothetical protein
MFNLDELKVLLNWYYLMEEFHHSDKEDDDLVNKIDKIIADMEEEM